MNVAIYKIYSLFLEYFKVNKKKNKLISDIIECAKAKTARKS